MTESAKLRIPYIAASQAQKHVTHNEALTLLDTLVQASVIDKDLTTPPISPAEGDCYIVAATGTGDWTGWDNRIARFIDGEWRSYLPGAGDGHGWIVYVQDEETLYVFDGTAWSQLFVSASISLGTATETLTGTEGSKAVTPDGLAALWEKGSNVASAATISLGEGGYFHITGTTGISDIDFATPKDGRCAILVFDGALTLTHGANLILPGAANIITAAGDVAFVVQDNGDAVRIVAYLRASGLPLLLSTDGTMAANSDALVPSQKAVKTYADGQVGLKQAFMYCQVAVPTADITIATALVPGQVHDGVTLTNGAPVFVWNQQASPAQNGVWISFDPPFRSPSFPAWANYVGALISVVQGNLYAGSVWQNINAIGGVLGTSALNFALRARAAPIVPPGGRLTNSSGVPVPIADVAGAGTVYYAPYLHQQVPIYDGVQFVPTDIGGALSQALSDTTKSPAAAANSSNYDLFVWNDAGTIRCTRGPAWSSATARGTGAGTTELERVKGIFLNKIAITNGPAAQRGTYVGTVRTNVSAQVDLKFGSKAALGGTAVIGLWNLYNRVPVAGMVMDDTNSWTYATATPRPFNGDSSNTNNRIDLIRGLAEDPVSVLMTSLTTSGASAAAGVGIGIDSTTVNSGASAPMTINNTDIKVSHWRGYPGLGFRQVYALEDIHAAATVTLFGDNGQVQNRNQSGLSYETRY